jgi:hypothetical protein
MGIEQITTNFPITGLSQYIFAASSVFKNLTFDSSYLSFSSSIVISKCKLWRFVLVEGLKRQN